jgi:hypothetical protein
LDAEVETPISFAPSTFPSWMEHTPTPPDAPVISSVSPALSRPNRTSASQAVM